MDSKAFRISVKTPIIVSWHWHMMRTKRRRKNLSELSGSRIREYRKRGNLKSGDILDGMFAESRVVDQVGDYGKRRSKFFRDLMARMRLHWGAGVGRVDGSGDVHLFYNKRFVYN